MEKIDTSSKIHVSAEIPEAELRHQIAALPRLNFIHVDHTKQSQSPQDNIITLARRDPALKAKLVLMANAGFHLYVLRDGVSSMVHHRRIPTLWRQVVVGEVTVDKNGVFSKLTPALDASDAPRLLVVFSAVAATMYTPSLMRHFEQNFATIAKYVTRNTHILRIVDLGGVLGSFYLNSNTLPDNERNIQARIAETAAQLGVNTENIVLYGTSKGGTAAAFHALQRGWRGVAVDPIVSDEHYVKKHRDLHFTLGTFPVPKQQRFTELADNVHPDARLSVICSSRSPQYPYITDKLIQPFRDRFLFLNSENPEIRIHPDVGPKTLPHTLSQLNLYLAGLEAPTGLWTVY